MDSEVDSLVKNLGEGCITWGLKGHAPRNPGQQEDLQFFLLQEESQYHSFPLVIHPPYAAHTSSSIHIFHTCALVPLTSSQYSSTRTTYRLRFPLVEPWSADAKTVFCSIPLFLFLSFGLCCRLSWRAQ
ncbi:hypothetical protein CEXT_99261 [Caerostris extrusa]|uniref:Uncharacterized protein n=1 Tax=Caerostris extrusa TaxID=172846 RepID=A0AAV4XKH7_CAEEX|nr:hypothetical protein CEXT_99261 [Caerostris extrusa]